MYVCSSIITNSNSYCISLSNTHVRKSTVEKTCFTKICFDFSENSVFC